jgi:hypothetical protein
VPFLDFYPETLFRRHGHDDFPCDEANGCFYHDRAPDLGFDFVDVRLVSGLYPETLNAVADPYVAGPVTRMNLNGASSFLFPLFK